MQFFSFFFTFGHFNIRTFDFAVMTKMRADTSTELITKRDDVVVRPEQRREDRRIGAVILVAVILRPNIHLGFTSKFQDFTDVLEISSTAQHLHTIPYGGVVFLIRLYS